MLTIEQERNMYSNFYNLVIIKICLCAANAKLNQLVAQEHGEDISDYDKGKLDAYLELFEELEKYDAKEADIRKNF